MGLHIQIFNAGSSGDIDAIFAAFARERPDALFVSPDPYFTVRRVQLATLAARHAIPMSFAAREPVDAGGLISYGPNINDAYRQTGVYTGRVLKGAKPSDLPIAQLSKFDLVINARTAQMLGLTVRVAARHCRRGDRITPDFAAPAHGRLWHNSDQRSCPLCRRSLGMSGLPRKSPERRE